MSANQEISPRSLTTDDAAKELRARFAKRGWNTKHVSVRKSYFSMGSSIDVTIRDPAISLRDVKEAADFAERVDRCEITGDILSGGNRYLHVKHSPEASVARGRPWVAAILEAKARIDEDRKADPHSSSGYPVVPGVILFPGRWNDSYELRRGGDMPQHASLATEQGQLEAGYTVSGMIEDAP